jgi:hypothetical protein
MKSLQLQAGDPAALLEYPMSKSAVGARLPAISSRACRVAGLGSEIMLTG